MEVLRIPRPCIRATTDPRRIRVFMGHTAPHLRRTVAAELRHQRIPSVMAPAATVVVRRPAVIPAVPAVVLAVLAVLPVRAAQVHVQEFHLQAH